MKLEYRIEENANAFTPQRRIWLFWISLTEPQPTRVAASWIIRTALMPRRPRFEWTCSLPRLNCL